MLATANAGFCVGPHSTVGQPDNRYRQLMHVSVLGARRIYKLSPKTRVVVFPDLHFEIVCMDLTFREILICSIKYEVCRVVLLSL